MIGFVIGVVVGILAFWQGRCWGWDRCARRNAELIRQRDEIIRERDRLYNEALWQRDRQLAELQRECERLLVGEPRMIATQLDEGTFRVTRVSSESRTFGGNIGNPQLLSAAYNTMEFGGVRGFIPTSGGATTSVSIPGPNIRPGKPPPPAT